MSCKVSFIGLGVMGYPMAGYISKAGHNVTVYNRTKSKAEKWIKDYKGNLAETPMDAAKESDYIFTCVGNDNDLREVTLGDKGFLKLQRKVQFISTIPLPQQILLENFIKRQRQKDLIFWTHQSLEGKLELKVEL